MPRVLLLALFLAGSGLAAAQAPDRARARDLGVEIGIFRTGTNNAITDVDGVRVGQTTVTDGDRVNTGVTAILPHPGNPYLSRVPAAIYVGNGYGKLVGATQVQELGEVESPILLTCTLCVWKAADAMVEWMLALPGMENVRSLNAVVGETNDGGLNDIRSRPIEARHVVEALTAAAGGPVAEGSVGAGRGTSAFGWKGGIGTSSRVLPDALGGYTVGVLVQSNFGGILTVGGAPVGEELGQYSFRAIVEGDRAAHPAREPDKGDGSIMIVLATDAPLSARNLDRLAKRAMLGLGRTGSFAGNGSGDYVIAFSTAESVRRTSGDAVPLFADLPNDMMSGLFQAVVEATEESVINSLFMATSVSGQGRTIEALPIPETLEVLRRYGVVPR